MACGTKMIPMINPDITSPQTYSRSLYLGSQRTTGKNPVRVDRTLGTEQVVLCFSLDLRTETAGCRWRTRRSRRGGGAGVVSVTLVTSSMVSGRTRRQEGERKREGRWTMSSAVLLGDQHQGKMMEGEIRGRYTGQTEKCKQ